MVPEAPAERAARLREHEMGDGGAGEAEAGGRAAVLSSHAQIAQIMSLSTPPPERERVRCTRTGREHR